MTIVRMRRNNAPLTKKPEKPSPDRATTSALSCNERARWTLSAVGDDFLATHASKLNEKALEDME